MYFALLSLGVPEIIGIAGAALVVIALIVSIITIIAFRKHKDKSEPALSLEEDQPAEEQTETVEPHEETVEEPREEVCEQKAEDKPVEEPTEEICEQEIEEDKPVEEPTEEPIEEKSAEAQPIAEEVKEQPKEEIEPVSEEDEEEEDKPVKTVARIDGHVRYIIIKYKKSFTAKLIQSNDTVKYYYSVIKNTLLSYKGVKTRMSWKGETFYTGRTTYAKLCIRGKSLGLFLALDPKQYADTKYIVDDMSEVAAYEKIPCLYRIKNDRRLSYSEDLIAAALGDKEKDPEYKQTDWVKKYPYEEIEPLIERNLVKVLTEEDAQSGDVFKPRDFVAAAEVDDIITDETAIALVEECDEISDKTKSAIINIDELSKYFENDEKVTLEEIKNRISSIPKSTTYIKVLARGVLAKRLVVVADSFSTQAIKMILLTGGEAIKKKCKE